MRKTILFALAFFSINAFSQGIRVSRTVCISTDCATDDMRALTSFLSSKDTEVLSICSTDGALSSAEGAEKIMDLLGSLAHQGIPVGIGDTTTYVKAPPFRSICKNCYWGKKDTLCHIKGTSRDVLRKSILSSQIKPYVVALGALTDIAYVIQDPKVAQRIKEIVWYDTDKGFNYQCDSSAFAKVATSDIPLRVISSGKYIRTDAHLTKMLHRVNNRYSQAINSANNSISSVHHSPIADELTALWVYFPDMFSVKKEKNVCYCTIRENIKKHDIYKALQKILSGELYRQNQIFAHFPKDNKNLREDVRKISDSIILRHGEEEWRAGVLTNELHGHLGIYAIIGVKMGLRAREYFCIGVDDMQIKSFTAENPPQSCLNDGLQVSTGGTFGHGLIHLANEEKHSAGAFFHFGEKKVIIRLKPDIQHQIENDIINILAQSKGLTREYWDNVRALALRYWLQMSRYDIFDIVNIDYQKEKN